MSDLIETHINMALNVWIDKTRNGKQFDHKMYAIVKRYERFARFTYCTVCRDMDEYVEYVSGVRQPNKWQIFVVIMTRVFLLINTLHFSALALRTNSQIQYLLLDWQHIKNK